MVCLWWAGPGGIRPEKALTDVRIYNQMKHIKLFEDFHSRPKLEDYEILDIYGRHEMAEAKERHTLTLRRLGLDPRHALNPDAYFREPQWSSHLKDQFHIYVLVKTPKGNIWLCPFNKAGIFDWVVDDKGIVHRPGDRTLREFEKLHLEQCLSPEWVSV